MNDLSVTSTSENDSLYKVLRSQNPTLVDRLMAEHGITAEMIDENWSTEQFYSAKGQTKPDLGNSFKQLRQNQTLPLGLFSPLSISDQYLGVPPISGASTDSGKSSQEIDWEKIYKDIRIAQYAIKGVTHLPGNVKNITKIVHGLRHGDEALSATDDVARAATDGAGEAVSYSDDALGLVSESTGVWDELLQFGIAGGNVPVLSMITSGIGYGFDQYQISQHNRRIHNAMLGECPADFKIAAEYYTKNKGNHTGSPLTKREANAFANLYECMAFNGGGKLLGQKILRDIGTPSGYLGGPGGGLGVLGVVKLMMAGEGIPTTAQVEEAWVAVASGGGVAVISGAWFPPSWFFTVPAFIAGNVAASRVHSVIKDWHGMVNNPAEQQKFLMQVGEFSSKLIAQNPEKFTDQSIRNRANAQVLRIAEKMAEGAHAHTTEEVRIMLRYARSFALWFGIASAVVEGSTKGHYQGPEVLKTPVEEGIAKFLKDARILEIGDQLILASRHYKGKGMSR